MPTPLGGTHPSYTLMALLLAMILFHCFSLCVCGGGGGGAIFVFSCDLNLFCSLTTIYVQVEIDWFLWGKWQCPFRYFLVMYIFW